ncbi:MAG: PEP-CTERM/exosortase system-associated acyltransferase [Methylobacter sp.]|nr:PEP-CTERM/exosortase system-associated acyltransferase [Methylobacter sp.]
MFDKHFEVFLADTPESKKQHYGIRYQVYCEEIGFKNRHHLPIGQEIDKWDEDSVHFIVRARQTGQWIGAMRMVFKNGHPLPLEEHGVIDKTINNHAIEVSRLCLVKETERRSPAGNSSRELACEKDKIKRRDNVIIFRRDKDKEIEHSIIRGLFRAAAIYSQERNIKKWYFLCTHALARIICKEGFNMKRIGESGHYEGERILFEIDLKDFFSNFKNINDVKKTYSHCSEIEMDKNLNRKDNIRQIFRTHHSYDG